MNAQEFLKYYKNPALTGEAQIPFWEELLREYPWFQEGWMLYLRSLRNAGDPRFGEMLPGVALRVRDRQLLRRIVEGETMTAPASPSDYLSREESLSWENREEPEATGISGQALVERFLAGGAAFGTLHASEPGRANVDLAEKAAEMSGEIISETFANLLVQQEKYNEAIDAFEKLSLRFPGKSIYFAARIEEVKRKMNY